VAGERFLQLEGNDVTPAAAIAVASLFKAVESGLVDTRDTIMLNITGGGTERFRREHELRTLEPSGILDLDAGDEDIVAAAEALFA